MRQIRCLKEKSTSGVLLANRICTLSWIYSSFCRRASSVTLVLQMVDFGDVNFILKRNIIAD